MGGIDGCVFSSFSSIAENIFLLVSMVLALAALVTILSHVCSLPSTTAPFPTHIHQKSFHAQDPAARESGFLPQNPIIPQHVYCVQCNHHRKGGFLVV
jgi:hypothetical protein